MTAVGWASVAAFAGIGLVALALALSARRRSAAALAIGLAGLLLVAGASTWLVRGWPADAIAERDGLKTEIAALREKTTALESQTAKAKRDADRQRGEIAERDQRIAQLQQGRAQTPPELATAVQEREQANAAREAFRTALEEARATAQQRDAEIARLQAEVRQRADAHKQAERDASTAQARVAELQNRIEDLERKPGARTEPTAITPPPPPTPPTSPQSKTPHEATAHLKGLLDRRLSTPYYSIERMSETEQVVGLNGQWYVVRLRLGGEPLVFPDRRFRLPEAEGAVQTSLQHLTEDILSPVARSARALRVFVRGGADSRQVIRDVDRPEISQLFVLPRLGDGRHGAEAIPREVPSSLGNDDLPGLRADWLRSVLRRVVGAMPLAGPVEILDEAPGDERGRTAELVLYVAW